MNPITFTEPQVSLAFDAEYELGPENLGGMFIPSFTFYPALSKAGFSSPKQEELELTDQANGTRRSPGTAYIMEDKSLCLLDQKIKSCIWPMSSGGRTLYILCHKKNRNKPIHKIVSFINAEFLLTKSKTQQLVC